jgi:hypothetical protein
VKPQNDQDEIQRKKTEFCPQDMSQGGREIETIAKFFTILWGVFTNRKTWPPEDNKDKDPHEK